MALLALDEDDEEEFSIEELGQVPEAIDFENPTNLSREDREFWYDPPIRSDTEIASANRRARYTQRGRTCLYPDCESKVRYTKPISYCEKHQDSEVARYTDPGEFYETVRINPRVHSLQKARRAQNLTQVQLGELSGISERRIEKFESGERGPSPEDRRILAETLGVKESELLRHPEKVVVSVW